jgi:hypothetical protein
VNTLLPEPASIAVEKPAPFYGDQAANDTMEFSLKVEAFGNPQKVRFLHVLQGADAGAPPGPVQLVRSIDGALFEGAVVRNIVTLFPVDLGVPVTSVKYRVPTGTRLHRITGLTPKTAYRIAVASVGSQLEVTITSGGTEQSADDAGVLEFTAQ